MESYGERKKKVRSSCVRNEDMVNPITFKWEWGEDEIPIVDQYTYLGGHISKDCSWDADTANMTGKGKSHVGEMEAVLTDSHLDAINRIYRCALTNVIVPKLEYARNVWERGREIRNKAGKKYV